MRFALLLAISLSFQAGVAAPAPDFMLKDLDGHVVRLSDYRGKVVVVNIWATWCPRCLAEMPELVKLQEEYKGKGLQVIGVSTAREARSKVVRIRSELKINYPLLRDTNEFDVLSGRAKVLPLTLVVDRNGVVQRVILGILEPEDLESIRQLFD